MLQILVEAIAMKIVLVILPRTERRHVYPRNANINLPQLHLSADVFLVIIIDIISMPLELYLPQIIVSYSLKDSDRVP